MSRGCSFTITKAERDAIERRTRVQETVLKLLQLTYSVSAQDVYLALDHLTPPPISPANSGNILAMLARQGVLASIMGVRTDGTDRVKREKGVILYTLPPRQTAYVPIYGSDAIRPLTKQDLMVGKARPRRERYVSLMDAPPEDASDPTNLKVSDRRN